MADDLSPHLALPYLLSGQAQKHVTVNAGLSRLDALVQLAVRRRDLNIPPATPEEGERQLIGPAPSGDWEGQAGRVALFAGGGWQFLAPRAGWRAWVEAEGIELIHDGSSWREGPGMLGVNTAPDAVNRLAVAAAGTLLTHAGGDHRLVINRASGGDTASMVFQSDWAGLAEIGLAGNDDLAFKAHDGAGWFEALRIERSSHALLTEGQMLYHQGNVLGPVSQASGVPSGALIEQGADAAGHWLRLADGTQICRHTLVASGAAATAWSFPKDFAAAPVVTGSAEATTLSALCLDAAPTVDEVSFSLRDGAGARRADRVHLLAVGRWV